MAYRRNGDSLASAHSTAETKKATIKLLRTIVVLTQTLKPLPDEVLMSMKLLYYDDSEPRPFIVILMITPRPLLYSNSTELSATRI